MNKLILLLSPLLFVSITFAQSVKNYNSLDPEHPIVFGGDHIRYLDEKIMLGPKAFFIDGQLSDDEAAKYPWVFNSIHEAAKHLSDGTEESPMVLYLAPWVYWIDNPDDPAIRVPKSGGVPFGLEIKCEWLKFYGLTPDAENVVLACNRGQTMGAKGNFTMFNISGEGTSTENITFGNYCNIDLEYPLKPELNRKKRGSAIVQAQLVFCDGDKLVARNTRFVSRLNLCPFVGGKRVLFDRCHFESTDDALNGTAVYLNCTLDFYSGKPFWGTFGTGAVFLNCDIQSFTRGAQYFTKSGGPVAVVDTRFESEQTSYLGWRDSPAKEARNYQYNVQWNGKPVFIGEHHPKSTVDMTGKPVLNAYRLVYKDKVIYNTYNLLKGDDDWDPLGIKELVLTAEKESGKKYTNLATQLILSLTRDTIETGKVSSLLRAQANKFGNYAQEVKKVAWSVAPEDESFVELKIHEDGTCEVLPANEHDETKEVIVYAVTPEGLEAASVLYVSPSFLDPPEFRSFPKIVNGMDGKLAVDYQLDMRFLDQSLVTWYRCSDAKGSDPIEIAVSRFNEPKLDYELSVGDIGWFIMAKVEPKHLRCHAGKPVFAITKQAISEKEVKANPCILKVDLRSLSTKYQPEVKPGFWTLDGYKPVDTQEYDWIPDTISDSWYYGTGVFGAANDTGLVQATKGARLRYTPVGNRFDDMKIQFTAVPAKTAGQGFSSAKAQYMDVCIQFDTQTLNGYALRLIRTTKYHNAIDFILMKYINGNAVPISEPVSASCYRPNCYITLEVKGNKLIAHAESPADYYVEPGRSEVVKKVDLEAEIQPDPFGGFGFQHTGSVGSGATMIKDLKIEWK